MALGTSTSSPFQKWRQSSPLLLPSSFQDLAHLTWKQKKLSSPTKEIQETFPLTHTQPTLYVDSGVTTFSRKPLRVGVLFSGGPAPGGHNVIAGLYDALKKIDPASTLIGFLGGPSGVIQGRFMPLEAACIDSYRNTGGFDLLGSGRDKIETEEQFAQVFYNLEHMNLQGLVIIGGDDSQTNSAFLAEYGKKKGSPVVIVGVPKTIDGDLKNDFIPIPFGFDTASKVYAELVGNIAKDAASAQKYYHFIRLMGRSASHITLEVALQTQPNYVLISEEIVSKKESLQTIVHNIATLIEERARKKKFFGVILFSEGLVESIGQIEERFLSQLDPHGNLPVSQIEFEKILVLLVKEELSKREFGKSIPFFPVHHFLGYEARASFPSFFDSHYTYALGYGASLLIRDQKNGYLTALTGLSGPVQDWSLVGVPLTSLMQEEMRKGKKKCVVTKRLVEMTDPSFLMLQRKRDSWRLDDLFISPGPIQFSGDPSVVQTLPYALTVD